MKAPWLKYALLGVNAPVSFPMFEQALPLKRALSQKNSLEPAHEFSLCVGMWAACHLAAFPSSCTHEVLPLEPCPKTDEQTPAFNSELTHFILTEILEKNIPPLFHEALTLLWKHNLKLPFNLLENSLEMGRRMVAMRPMLLKTLGVKGTWLAQHNQHWQYAYSQVKQEATDNDETLWHEGNLVQREDFFKNCRAKTPDHARQLLEQQLPKLPAKERLTFVLLLENELSLADEPLLNTLLKDRSKEVREKAAHFLSHIPNSNYTQKITQWMQTLVTQTKGLLSKKWQCEAPLKFESEWEALGLSAKPPAINPVGGERSWWLYQLVSKTPLSWWGQHTQMSAKELVTWAKSTDWHEALQGGWSNNISIKDIEWIKLMLEPQKEWGRNKNYMFYAAEPIFSRLSSEDRMQIIESLDEKALANLPTLQILTGSLSIEDELPVKTSQHLIKLLFSHYAKNDKSSHYSLSNIYLSLVWKLAPQTLVEFKIPPTYENKKDSAVYELLEKMDQAVKTRQKLHAYFDAIKNQCNT